MKDKKANCRRRKIFSQNVEREAENDMLRPQISNKTASRCQTETQNPLEISVANTPIAICVRFAKSLQDGLLGESRKRQADGALEVGQRQKVLALHVQHHEGFANDIAVAWQLQSRRRERRESVQIDAPDIPEQLVKVKLGRTIPKQLDPSHAHVGPPESSSALLVSVFKSGRYQCPLLLREATFHLRAEENERCEILVSEACSITHVKS